MALAGYMGAAARVFHSNDALCIATDYSYNGTASASQYKGVYSYCGAAYFYSYGVARAYNGNGYSSYYLFKSPNKYLTR